MIQPEYRTLDEVLTKRLFRIPNYQRFYSWGKTERKYLFDDIGKLFNQKDSERHHFMATLVFLKPIKSKTPVGTDEFTTLDIVDGQQRLTTLIVLLKVIQIFLEKSDKKEADKLQDTLIKESDQRLILLQTNHDSQNILLNYLKESIKPHKTSIQTIPDNNLLDAFIECEKYVKDNWIDKRDRDVIDLLKLIKNRLSFIFYQLDDEGAVYTVFEVLNSRGLEVDCLDKCKSLLMGIVFEEYFQKEAASENINMLHSTWSKIYRLIGLKNMGLLENLWVKNISILFN